MNAHRHAPRHQQGGAALIVGLLLLMVLTIISLSGLKNTRRQQQMTSNAEFELRTFAAAESAIRDVFNEARYLRPPPAGEVYILREAIQRADDGTAPITRQPPGFADFQVGATLTYRGTSVAPGSTANQGTGAGYVVHNYDIDGQAILDPADPLSRSFHRQAIGQLGPN